MSPRAWFSLGLFLGIVLAVLIVYAVTRYVDRQAVLEHDEHEDAPGVG